MQENNYIVYMHTTPDEKKYVGITRQDIKNRWRNGYGYMGQYFFEAIQKFGWDNITHEILYSNLSKEEAMQKEKQYIALYKLTDQNFGYNKTKGGQSPPQHGKPIICLQTKEIFPSAIEASKKYGIYSRHIGEICISKYGRRTAGGKHWAFYDQSNDMTFYSEKLAQILAEQKEVKQKKYKQLSETLKQNSPFKKPVICLDTQKKYESITAASQQLNIPISYIQRVCSGERRKTSNLHFSYYEEDKTDDYYLELLQKIKKEQQAPKIMSQEMKQKLVKANSIPVRCVQTGMIYSSIAQANRHTGVDKSSICSCCKGKRKTAKGYHWQYANKEDIN